MSANHQGDTQPLRGKKSTPKTNYEMQFIAFSLILCLSGHCKADRLRLWSIINMAISAFTFFILALTAGKSSYYLDLVCLSSDLSLLQMYSLSIARFSYCHVIVYI